MLLLSVSPANTNVEETLNTLKSPNCAQNIQNKAVVSFFFKDYLYLLFYDIASHYLFLLVD